MLNRAPHRAKEPVRIGVTVVSPNSASFDYFLVENSLPAFAIVRRQYHESGYALQISSGVVWPQSCLFGASQWLEP